MILELLRAIFGLVLILFIPGYALTWAFYPVRKDITDSERIALSFALSISGVMLWVLFIDLVLGIDTTPINLVLAIIVLTLLSLVAWRLHLNFVNLKLKDEILKGFFRSIKKLKNIKLRKNART